MQRSLTSLSSRFLPACRFILHPASRLVSRSIHLLAFRKEYLVGIGRGVCSVLLNGHRSYIRGVDTPRERPRNSSKNEAIALNKEITGLGKEGKWKEILLFAEKNKDRFNNVNWATAFSQLGRARNLDRRDPLLRSFMKEYAACLESRGLQWAGIRQLANVVHAIGKMKLKNPETKAILMFVLKKENTRKIVQEGNSQNVANVAWALATLGIKSHKLFSEIESRADWLVTNGKPQEVANAAWAFATLGVKAPKLFAAIETRTDWLVANGTPQGVANTAWAFATLGVKSPKLFAGIETRADWLISNGTPQNVANTAWAFATLDAKSAKLFAAIETRADWLVTSGKPQEVANTAWAFATLGVKLPKLFATIENRADWLVTSGNSQGVANTAWAFATLGVKSPKLFAAIEHHADWLVTSGKPQEVGNTAWAFASLGVKSPKLFAAIENHADWLISNGTPQGIANTIWAASRFQYHSPQLMQETNLCGAWLGKEGSTQDISNAAIAFANYGYNASTFFTEVASNVSKLINEGNPQAIINICYAMAILDLGKKHHHAFGQLWNSAINLDTTILPNEALRQLSQVLAFCTANGMKLQQPSALLSQRIGAVVLNSTQSKYQREVATMLRQLGLAYEEEVSPLEGSIMDNSMLSIDFACKTHMLAIEYDGEYHFLRELGTGKVTQQENGTTKAKRRFLKQMGWNVVNINYQDWMDAEKKNYRLEFLREKLDQAGIQLQ